MAMWPGMFSVRRESLLGEAALFGVQEYLMMMMAEPKRRNVSVFYWTGILSCCWSKAGVRYCSNSSSDSKLNIQAARQIK